MPGEKGKTMFVMMGELDRPQGCINNMAKDGVAMLFTLRERPEDIRSGVVKGSR